MKKFLLKTRLWATALLLFVIAALLIGWVAFSVHATYTLKDTIEDGKQGFHSLAAVYSFTSFIGILVCIFGWKHCDHKVWIKAIMAFFWIFFNVFGFIATILCFIAIEIIGNVRRLNGGAVS